MFFIKIINFGQKNHPSTNTDQYVSTIVASRFSLQEDCLYTTGYL